MIRQTNFRQQIDTNGKRKLTPEGESKFMLTIKDFKIKSQLATDKEQYLEVQKNWYNLNVV